MPHGLPHSNSFAGHMLDRSLYNPNDDDYNHRQQLGICDQYFSVRHYYAQDFNTQTDGLTFAQ